MECPNCHKKISDKSSKCPYCGKILAAGKLNFAAKQKKEETPQKNTLPTMEFSKSNEKHMNFASAPDKAEMPNNAAAPIPEAAEKPSANQTELMKQKIEKSSRYASEEEHEEVKDSTVSSSLPATYEHEEVEPEKHDPVSKSKEKKKLCCLERKRRKGNRYC